MTASPRDYGVYHLRRVFDLAERPRTFRLRVSADNRYRLLVNGTAVSEGPARGDLAHWRYETVDLAEHLRVGRNVIAALNWNMGEHGPFAQMTHRTGFILEGLDEASRAVNTDGQWRILRNKGYSPLPGLQPELSGPGHCRTGPLLPAPRPNHSQGLQ